MWKLQDAKNQFSELVERAIHEGPQVVTRHGHEAVVVISATDYRKRRRPGPLSAFLKASKLKTIASLMTREQDFGRDVDL
jgi:antitoxin Phd